MGSAKYMYTNQVSPGVRSPNSALAGSWPFVVHVLIKRYFPDDVLQRAYEMVTDARQKPEEDESKFADRVIAVARDCFNVFEDRELVNYYIRGLLPSTRDALTEAVRQLPVNEQGDITVARCVAHAHGNTFRTRRTQSNSTPVKLKSRGHVMTMPELAETSGRHVPTSSFVRDPTPGHVIHGPMNYWAAIRTQDPESALQIATKLEALLFAFGSHERRKSTAPVSPSTENSQAQSIDILHELVHKNTVAVPKLSE